MFFFQLPTLDVDMEVALLGLLKVVKGTQYQWRSQM